MGAGSQSYLFFLSVFGCRQVVEILSTEDPITSKAVFVIKIDKVTFCNILILFGRQPH